MDQHALDEMAKSAAEAKARVAALRARQRQLLDKAGTDVTKREPCRADVSQPDQNHDSEISGVETGQDTAASLEAPRTDGQTRPSHAQPRQEQPMTLAAAHAAYPQDEVFLRRDEAARLARMSVWKLDELRRQYPDFPIRRVGPRTLLIPRDEFLQWLSDWGRLPPPKPPYRPRKGR